MNDTTLILASASPRRSALLRQIGVAHEVVAPVVLEVRTAGAITSCATPIWRNSALRRGDAEASIRVASFTVVGVAGKQSGGAIQLFSQQHARQRVRQGQRGKREAQRGT